MNEEQESREAEGESKASPLRHHLQAYGHPGAAAGISFAVVLVVFTLGGWWLDTSLGTSPLCLLVGFGLGAVGGFIHLVEQVSPGTLFGKRSRTPGQARGEAPGETQARTTTEPQARTGSEPRGTTPRTAPGSTPGAPRGTAPGSTPGAPWGTTPGRTPGEPRGRTSGEP